MENIFNKFFGDPAVTDDFKSKFADHFSEYLKKVSITHIILIAQAPNVLTHYYGKPADIIALLLATLIKIVEDQKSNLDEKDFEEGKRQIIDALKYELNI